MPFQLGVIELSIILAIIILLFGGGRIARLGRELGAGIRELRESVKEEGSNE